MFDMGLFLKITKPVVTVSHFCCVHLEHWLRFVNLKLKMSRFACKVPTEVTGSLKVLESPWISYELLKLLRVQESINSRWNLWNWGVYTFSEYTSFVILGDHCLTIMLHRLTCLLETSVGFLPKVLFIILKMSGKRGLKGLEFCSENSHG